MVTVDSLLASSPRHLRFEAELLIAAALQWNRAKVLAFGDQQIPERSLPELQDQLGRLRNGEPFAYLVGRREFYGLEFEVTPDVLIPRPDTELLVTLAIERSPPSTTLLDLGTGSGAIAVSVAHHRPDLQIIATDASQPALRIARRNAHRHGCTVQFIASDWFQQLPRRFSTIVSNPPYIREDDPHLSELGYEPRHALVAEAKGLAALEHIIRGASDHLTITGSLLVEHGYDQAEQVATLFKQEKFTDICLHNDLAGLPRVTSGVLT